MQQSKARARARVTDPGTSHKAAAWVESTGKARDQRALCLKAVVLSPGSTAGEIADATGLERHAPSRRLPELRKAGLIVNGITRRCEILGTLSMTWWPSKEIK